MPTSATTVENFLRDQVNIKNVWRVVQGFLEKFTILIAKTLLNLKIILALKEIYQWEFIVIMKQQPQLKTILTLNKKKMFVVSFVLIVAFHAHLNITKIVVQRSYGHSISQLTTIDYLSED